MISTAIIPRLCKSIEVGAFDPYSAKNVQSMLDIAEQLEASVETNNVKFQVRFTLDCPPNINTLNPFIVIDAFKISSGSFPIFFD